MTAMRSLACQSAAVREACENTEIATFCDIDAVSLMNLNTW